MSIPKDPERYRQYIEKISGRNNPMYGKTFFRDSIEKMRESKRGGRNANSGKTWTDSEKTVGRKRRSHSGKIDSEETRQRKRRASLGNRSSLGRRDSEETRLRRSEGAKGKPPNEGGGKTKWYSYTRLQDDVTIRVCGSYETGTCIYLDLAEEPGWLYTGTGRYPEHKLLLSDGRHWHPDFWIPRLGFYIDVKGYWREGDRAKLALEEYPDRVKVLLGDTYLEQLGRTLS